MTLERLLILTLATWYLSFALTSTSGPGGLFSWIREHVWHGRTGYNNAGLTDERGALIAVDRKYMHNGLLDCIICLAPWIALVLWLVPDGVVVWAFAAAGLGLLAHGWSGWRYNT